MVSFSHVFAPHISVIIYTGCFHFLVRLLGLFLYQPSWMSAIFCQVSVSTLWHRCVDSVNGREGFFGWYCVERIYLLLFIAIFIQTFIILTCLGLYCYHSPEVRDVSVKTWTKSAPGRVATTSFCSAMLSAFAVTYWAKSHLTSLLVVSRCIVLTSVIILTPIVFLFLIWLPSIVPRSFFLSPEFDFPDPLDHLISRCYYPRQLVCRLLVIAVPPTQVMQSKNSLVLYRFHD